MKVWEKSKDKITHSGVVIYFDATHETGESIELRKSGQPIAILNKSENIIIDRTKAIPIKKNGSCLCDSCKIMGVK